MITEGRIWLLVVMVSLSIIDLLLTHHYISKYKKWQPNKPLGLIEMNPLLVLLMTYLGITLGMLLGGIFILGLISYISLKTHLLIVGLLFFLLGLALYNHIKNIDLLNKLIEKYPSGHLPKKTFGHVEGNNVR